MAENIIKIEKVFRGKIKAWDEESRKAKKPFCQTCARQDYINGRLANDWTNYANLEFIRKTEVRDSKDRSKLLGEMHDFKCPRGHGISVEIFFPTDEYGRHIDVSKIKKR